MASHDMVQVGVGQKYLCGLGLQPCTKRLKGVSFLTGRHARVRDKELALTEFHDIRLFSKAIACERMHHEA